MAFEIRLSRDYCSPLRYVAASSGGRPLSRMEESLKSHMSFSLMVSCLLQYCYESSLRDLLLGKREESGPTRAEGA
jgi:hypothetical protein